LCFRLATSFNRLVRWELEIRQSNQVGHTCDYTYTWHRNQAISDCYFTTSNLATYFHLILSRLSFIFSSGSLLLFFNNFYCLRISCHCHRIFSFLISVLFKRIACLLFTDAGKSCISRDYTATGYIQFTVKDHFIDKISIFIAYHFLYRQLSCDSQKS
jgi:hypothetical protein